MTTSPQLSTTRATALYIGALLGPSLLLLPGLAAGLAGPASILVWIGLLALSGLLAQVFVALGVRFPTGGGVATCVTAGFGPRAGRAISWCFLAGVVCGAPVVCLIGGSYVAELLGGGHRVSVIAAAVLLAIVIALTFGGARAATTVQLVLVALLVGLLLVAVLGSAPAARTVNWTPFLPHGWTSLGSAASVLMLSFVGWEAIAPLTARLREPSRQLPRVIAIAFVVTAVVYLALAASTIGVLGPRAGTAVPLAGLLRVAIGASGPAVAAVAAVALTLAATNAYFSGARALAADLRTVNRSLPDRRLQIGIVAIGVILLGGAATGYLSTAQLVSLPTTLFLVVYLGATAAAWRIFSGRIRIFAVTSCCAVAGILCFTGWALLVPLGIVIAAIAQRPRSIARPQISPTNRVA